MQQPSGPQASSPIDTPAPAPPAGLLDWIEWAGNKLPEPALLFALLAGVVIVVSAIGSAAGWKAQPVEPRIQTVAATDSAGNPLKNADGSPLLKPKLGADGRPEVTLVAKGDPISPRNLLTVEGFYWMLSSMVRNFVTLPALGLVFVGMLGIGLAEKFGFFSAFMRVVAMATPKSLLTPIIVLIGANASVASDAGYIILPPLAAALFLAVGRSPIAGLAAAFAGVAGGFGGGFFPNAADGFLAGTATQAAQILDPDYSVLATHNLYFKAGSAIVIMFAGWFVTDRIVEPRLMKTAAKTTDDEAAAKLRELALTSAEKRGLGWSALAMIVVLAIFAALILIPGAPLYGTGQPLLANGLPAPGERAGPRWSHVIVPIIFFAFLIPGMAYGWSTGVLRTQKDFIEAIYHGIKTIVPVLAIAFFMGQFVNYFQYTGLDRMLAYSGGALLVKADLPAPVLLVLFVFLVVLGDFAISGMLSKFGVLCPIFVPMFMMVGISPELTTAAYRIGDSVVNIITPLNSYLLIILVALQKYKPGAGLGSLISLMAPYSVVFFFIWTGFLLLWYALGIPLGIGGPLEYVPRQ